MKNPLVGTTLFALLIFSFGASAGPISCNDSFNLCKGTVTKVNVDGLKNIFITFQGQTSPSGLLPTACGATSAFTFSVPAETFDAKTQINSEFFSMALAAHISGTTLEITAFSDTGAGVPLPTFCKISNMSVTTE